MYSGKVKQYDFFLDFVLSITDLGLSGKKTKTSQMGSGKGS
jgi:hypothetical protein